MDRLKFLRETNLFGELSKNKSKNKNIFNSILDKFSNVQETVEDGIDIHMLGSKLSESESELSSDESSLDVIDDLENDEFKKIFTNVKGSTLAFLNSKNTCTSTPKVNNSMCLPKNANLSIYSPLCRKKPLKTKNSGQMSEQKNLIAQFNTKKKNPNESDIPLDFTTEISIEQPDESYQNNDVNNEIIIEHSSKLPQQLLQPSSSSSSTTPQEDLLHRDDEIDKNEYVRSYVEKNQQYQTHNANDEAQAIEDDLDHAKIEKIAKSSNLRSVYVELTRLSADQIAKAKAQAKKLSDQENDSKTKKSKRVDPFMQKCKRIYEEQTKEFKQQETDKERVTQDSSTKRHKSSKTDHFMSRWSKICNESIAKYTQQHEIVAS